jgi:hypothetical protein
MVFIVHVTVFRHYVFLIMQCVLCLFLSHSSRESRHTYFRLLRIMHPRPRTAPTRLAVFDEDSAGEADARPPRKKAKAAGPSGQSAGTARAAAAAAPIKLTLTLGGAPLAEAATAAVAELEVPQHSKEELQLLQKYVELREALLARERRAGASAGADKGQTATSVSDAAALLHGDSSMESSAQKRPSAKRGRPGPGSSMRGAGMGLAAPPQPPGALGSGGPAASEDWD